VQHERTKTTDVDPLEWSALVVHRRSGTATDWNGPGSATHRGSYALLHLNALAALRRARDTQRPQSS